MKVIAQEAVGRRPGVKSREALSITANNTSLDSVTAPYEVRGP